MIEITGCPGTGKSTLFPDTADISNVFLFFCFPVVFLKLFIFHNLIFRYLFINALCLNRSFKYKLAFLYHSFRKFVVYFAYHNSDVVIDEGLSHIAFNLELNSSDRIINFFYTFRFFLKSTDIVIVTCNEDSLFNRISQRGHKRLYTFKNLNMFIKCNKKVESLLIQLIEPFVGSLRIVINEK